MINLSNNSSETFDSSNKGDDHSDTGHGHSHDHDHGQSHDNGHDHSDSSE